MSKNYPPYDSAIAPIRDRMSSPQRWINLMRGMLVTFCYLSQQFNETDFDFDFERLTTSEQAILYQYVQRWMVLSPKAKNFWTEESVQQWNSDKQEEEC